MHTKLTSEHADDQQNETSIEKTKTVLLKVQAVTQPGETVVVSGDAPQLGNWAPSKVVPLSLEDASRCIWSGRLTIPSDRPVHFRYLIVMLIPSSGSLNNDEDQHVIVRRWEAPIKPRYLGSAYSEIADQIDIFGSYDGVELVEPGWLTTDTVIQLKLFNNPITIWKRRFKDVDFTFRVTPIDLDRRSDHSFDDDDDSTQLEAHLKWPVVEIAVMNEQESSFNQQAQFGHLYNPSDYVIFQARVLNPKTIAYMVDFYTKPSSEGMVPEHMGFCYILPSNLREASGTCTMPISGKKQQPIGQMTVEYLVVSPLQNFSCDARVSYAHAWHQDKKTVLDVGHRGAGNHRRKDTVENVLENTVASFNYAARHGADMVELDVQLSKDLVPVIYHDYNICISMKKKRSQCEHELLQVAVGDLTVKQLQLLKLSPVKSHGYNFEEDDAEDNQPFPTLQHVLEAVDPRVGFNIEIKCPQQLRDGSWEAEATLDLNTYVDIILRAILEHAGSRIVILSCFHPDICTMVRLKQNKYPLLFLTQGITERYPPYLDTRTSSVPMAAFFALCLSLLGINVHAEDLLRESSLISFVKSHNLVLFCWGEDINHSDVVQRLKNEGVDGVIYDKIDEFSNATSKVFLLHTRNAAANILEMAHNNGTPLPTSWSSTSTTSI